MQLLRIYGSWHWFQSAFKPHIMSLADYLAKNYLEKPKKAKKALKSSTHETPLNIQDVHDQTSQSDTENGDEGPLVVEHIHSKENRGWIKVATKEKVDKTMMQDGSFAGLQTSSTLRESMVNKQRQHEAEVERTNHEYNPETAQTVYRDLQGRKLNAADIKSQETVQEKKQREKRQREDEIKELNRSELDSINKKQRQEELEKVSRERLNVYENSEEYNRAKQDELRTDDPMLVFDPAKARKLSKSKHVSLTGRKLYEGSFPQNRFGVVPGYRWDGIDRGNGYENKRFAKQAEAQERKIMDYTMAQDL